LWAEQDRCTYHPTCALWVVRNDHLASVWQLPLHTHTVSPSHSHRDWGGKEGWAAHAGGLQLLCQHTNGVARQQHCSAACTRREGAHRRAQTAGERRWAAQDEQASTQASKQSTARARKQPTALQERNDNRCLGEQALSTLLTLLLPTLRLQPGTRAHAHARTHMRAYARPAAHARALQPTTSKLARRRTKVVVSVMHAVAKWMDTGARVVPASSTHGWRRMAGGGVATTASVCPRTTITSPSSCFTSQAAAPHAAPEAPPTPQPHAHTATRRHGPACAPMQRQQQRTCRACTRAREGGGACAPPTAQPPVDRAEAARGVRSPHA
jgi:hypothetical protein